MILSKQKTLEWGAAGNLRKSDGKGIARPLGMFYLLSSYEDAIY